MPLALLRRGERLRLFVDPQLRDATGTVERDPGEVEKHRLSGPQCFQIREAIALEHACAGLEVEHFGLLECWSAGVFQC